MTSKPITAQEKQQWIISSKSEAPALLSHADTVCRQLFSEGDLTEYLLLLSRLHQYDYRNLLLLYDQYPTATCLAAITVWKAYLPESAKILKDTAVGKGIRLLAPFTEYRNGKYYLIWHRVLQFDISQTNVKHYPKPASPYLFDQAHLTYLADALRAALGYLYQKSLLLVHSNNPTLPPQLSYRITSESVVIRSREEPLSRAQLLTEVLGLLYAAKAGLSSDQQRLFAQCFCFCLFEIWKLQEQPWPVPTKAQLTAIPGSEQPGFLNHLQRAVRMTEETVACAYRLARQEDLSEPLDDDISELLGITSGMLPGSQPHVSKSPSIK